MFTGKLWNAIIRLTCLRPDEQQRLAASQQARTQFFQSIQNAWQREMRARAEANDDDESDEEDEDSEEEAEQSEQEDSEH